MAKTIKFSEALANYNTIMKDIAERRFAPIYLLSGDEGYFIDTLDQGDNVALLDADKLKFPLRVRRWQEGDWFVPFGMSGRKKLSDYLIDKKVSMAEKSRQFVLLSGDDIVWVVGRRLDDRYAITRKTENVLKVIRYTL